MTKHHDEVRDMQRFALLQNILLFGAIALDKNMYPVAVYTLIAAALVIDVVYLINLRMQKRKKDGFHNKCWGSEAERPSYTQHFCLLRKKR